MSLADSYYGITCKLVDREPWMDAMAAMLSLGSERFNYQ